MGSGISDFIASVLIATWQILVESSVLLLIGIVLAGVLHIILDEARIVRLLGRDRIKAVLRASLYGVPLSLCSCSVLPVADSLRRSGAGTGATTSFLISTPETGVDSVLLTYSLMDPIMTVARPVTAFATAFTAGLLVNTVTPSEASLGTTHPAKAADCDCEPIPTQPASERESRSLLKRIGEGLRYADRTILSDLAPYLLVGYLLAGLVAVVFGGDLLNLPSWLQSGWGSYAGAVVIGLPLYVCATSSTPLAAVLLGAGFSPGAILVFLMVGPATNVATLAVISRILDRRALVVYLLSVVGVSILAGLAIDLVYSQSGIIPDFSQGVHAHGPGAFARVAAVLTAALILWHSGRSLLHRHR